MAAALSDAQLEMVRQQIQAHPEILQAFKGYQQWASKRGRMAYVTGGGPPNPQQVLKQYGITFPDIEDYQIQMDPSGQVQFKRENWFQRNADWILPVATIGTGGAANALAAGGAGAGAGAGTSAASGGGGAASAGTTLGEAGPLSADEVFTAGPVAGTGLSGVDVAGMGTAAKTTSVLHDLLPSIIGAGAGVGGAAIAAHANTEAAKIAAAQADKALAIQQQQYALQRQDTAPYRALGQGAVNNLGYLGGIDTTSNLAALSSATPAIPSGANPSENLAPVVALGAKDASGQPMPGAGLNQTMPRPPTPAQQGLGALSQPSGGTVRIQDPATGLVHLIPQAQAADAQAAGGRLV